MGFVTRQKILEPMQSIPLCYFEYLNDTTKWIAPLEADRLQNPISASEEATIEGGLVYKKYCRSCHGRDGDGKGVEAATLKTTVNDFTNPLFLEQSDGSMFWKISEGRNDMQSFKDILSEEEIWKVILYVKTFGSQ